MSRKSPAYVTEVVFKKESKAVHDEFNAVHNEFKIVHDEFKTVHDEFKTVHDEFKTVHNKVDRLAVAFVKMRSDVDEMKMNMATKSDIDRILTQITDFSKDTHIALQNQEIHRGYIHDHELRLMALEKRSIG